MSVLFKWKNILEIEEGYSLLWGLKYFTYRKEVPKERAFRMSLT